MVRKHLKKTFDLFKDRFSILDRAYVALRAEIVLRKYRQHRERYHAICEERGIVYDESSVIKRTKQLLRDRGYLPVKRKLGEVHTFAFIPRLGWHRHLLPDLYELGPTDEYDYVTAGFDPVRTSLPNTMGLALRRELNSQWYEALVKAHSRAAVDWVFFYAGVNMVQSDMVRRIREELGIPTVHMCLDDKHCWEGPWLGEQRGSQIDLVPVFDLSWTSSRTVTEWYLVEGGQPLYMPEGCDAQFYHPLRMHKDIPVSFVGMKYGFRSGAIKYLQKNGVDVRPFGSGWTNNALTDTQMITVFCRSIVNLGMGGIGSSEYLTTIKGRDFEIPCTGGGMYLTSFNPDLSLHFDVGKEIVCYRSRDEMLELIRYYLSHTDDARQIAAAGRKRCLREHRWLHRYLRILSILDVLDSSSVTQNPASYVGQQGHVTAERTVS